MTPSPVGEGRSRILVVDDNPAIHEDFRKILCGPGDACPALDDLESNLFGGEASAPLHDEFEIDSAYQGQEGLARIQQALADGHPYALAFVDVRMPPGWDGIETLEQIWRVYPELQAVICTAYTEYSWEDVARRLGHADDLLILKKPFETVEILQMAHALTRKWILAREAQLRMEDLDRMVRQRTAELLTANHRLEQEIEERRRVQDALRSSEERFAKAFRMGPIPMAIAHCEDRRFIDANPAFAALLGRPREDILGATDFDLGLWDACPEDTLSALYPRRRVEKRICRIRAAAGDDRQVSCSTEPVVLDGEPSALLILEDLTDLLRLEEQLRQAQKLESVGLLAGGVAHEFNNILTVIQGNIGMLQIEGNEPDDIALACTEVLEASDRAAILTSQLLAFSSKGMLQRRNLDLSAVVQACRHRLGKLLGDDYSLDMDCAVTLPPILADESSLVQVLMNLAANARDATPRGGTIRIQTALADVAEHELPPGQDARPGAYGVLTITDSGSGIDDQTRVRIFDPFFTTKERGRGTGLGLSMVLGIVKQHQGWIDVQSRPGHGASFIIHFPVNPDGGPVAPAGESLSADPADVPRGSGEAILVVEDERQVRELLCTVLQNHGYRPIAAGSGREALDRHRAGNYPIDLLITDMVMPGGVSGDELARDLLAARPGLKIICVSGYTPKTPVQDICRGLGARFVRKPYTFAHLLRLVRQCLQEREPSGVA